MPKKKKKILPSLVNSASAELSREHMGSMLLLFSTGLSYSDIHGRVCDFDFKLFVHIWQYLCIMVKFPLNKLFFHTWQCLCIMVKLPLNK